MWKRCLNCSSSKFCKTSAQNISPLGPTHFHMLLLDTELKHSHLLSSCRECCCFILFSACLWIHFQSLVYIEDTSSTRNIDISAKTLTTLKSVASYPGSTWTMHEQANVDDILIWFSGYWPDVKRAYVATLHLFMFNFLFFLSSQLCVHVVVRFRHKDHLVNERKTSCLHVATKMDAEPRTSLKKNIQCLLPHTLLETTPRSPL